MNIILIGYRATGKTTLAQILAKKLQWQWIDADVVVEQRAGKSIARIFAEDGEAAFRDLEAEVTADLCKRNHLVLAAGGGAPLRLETRQRMRKSGHVVWLTASPAAIHARMSGDATTADRRPSLTDKSALDEIVHLLEKRSPIYRETAHLTVDTEGKSPDQIANEILESLPIQPSAEGTA